MHCTLLVMDALFLYLPIKAYCREQQLRRCSGSEQSGMLKKVSSCKFILSFIFLFNYRVSHETWQLLNNFVCLLPFIILDNKDFLHVISLKTSFSQIILIWNQFFNNKIGIQCFSSISLISNNLTNNGRRHFKLFANCHVSWDTL